MTVVLRRLGSSLHPSHTLVFQVGERKHSYRYPHMETDREEGERETEPAAGFTTLPVDPRLVS